MDVHLGERLLHALDAGADGVHMVSPLTPVGPQDANRGGGMKRIAEEPVGVEFQQPLALLDIGLSAGEVLGVPRIHQIDLQPPRLEDLIHGNPIDTGRLHRDGRHATLL